MNTRLFVCVLLAILVIGCQKSSDSYKSYDDCILINLKNTSNNAAVYAIQKSCKQKFIKKYDFDEIAVAAGGPTWKAVIEKSDYQNLTYEEKNEAKTEYLKRFIYKNTHPEFEYEVNSQFAVFDEKLQASRVTNQPSLNEVKDNSISSVSASEFQNKDSQEIKNIPQEKYINSQKDNPNDLSRFFKEDEARELRVSKSLSTFFVDNSAGQSDTVVKLYLNGSMPAEKTFTVRRGEIYKSDGLAPGLYTMRYKNILSEEVFEMRGTFEAKEVKTKSGVAFSNFTVTLYKTSDGNLKSIRVDPRTF